MNLHKHTIGITPMISKVFKINHLVQALLAGLTYSLGAGIAHYLGNSIKFGVFGIGLLASLALQGSAFFLADYFRLPLAPLDLEESFRQREKFRLLLLLVSYAALALSTIFMLDMLLTHTITLSAGIFYLLILVCLMAYAIPPFRLSVTGFGEFVNAVFLGTFLPAFAFLLQTGSLHRLVFFTSFPFTLLALAFLLAWDFPTFATDQKLAHYTLLTRLTWQRAVPIHHSLILFSFLFFSFAPFLDIPWGVIWPVFLALPIAALQIYWLQQIANGRRTLWNFFSAIATATIGLSVYLLVLTFWIR
jgi:1,4-dihydroxy-2-naphthoate octaprenyltransferase